MTLQEQINQQLLGDLKSLTAVDTATNLLKGTGITAAKFNAKCLDQGYLERATRPSKSKPGELKTFWKITEKGIGYGVNQKDQREPLESTPRWFTKDFQVLLILVGFARPA